MKQGIDKILLSIILSCVLSNPQAMAQDSAPATVYDAPNPVGEAYGTTVGRKLGSGFANMTMGWIEIPKNAINVTNALDTKYVLFGVVGGIVKGTLHTVGRTLVGVVDVLTFPLPTKSMIDPNYVWDKFREDTSYGPFFILTDAPQPMQGDPYQ